ncbi:MAG: sugar kinase [Firmicutes bacterium]|jgi:ribokinase|nr:sugar kinase [Bacillota bacterium]
MGFEMVGLGLCTHDYIAVVPRIPEFESSVRMRAVSEQGGGPAATATVAARRLGVDAAFVGVVGDDHSGRFILEEFRRYGVDISQMKMRPGETSQFVICLVEESTGRRGFVSSPATVRPLQIDEIDPGLIRSAGFLHLDGRFPEVSIEAAKIAREAGVTVVLDATTFSGTKDLLGYVDILITSRFFYEEIAEGESPLDVVPRLLDYGAREAIITLGEQGCVCADEKGSFHLPAFDVQPVVDTTGCGDVFHGAYIAAKLRGYGLRKAAQFASAVAGLKVRALGGRQGIPDIDEVLQFLQQRLPDEWAKPSSQVS